MPTFSPQVVNFLIVLAMIPISKQFDFNNPVVVNGCRAAYVLSNLMIASIYLYIQMAVNKKKDMTTLKYVEPPALGSTEEGKVVTTTIHEYDSTQVAALFRSQLMGVGMMAFMHLYLKYTNPLLVQSIIPLKGALECNLAKIYVWGQPASGDLKRPFKQTAGLMEAMQQGPAQNKRAIEAAERAGRGGAKED